VQRLLGGVAVLDGASSELPSQRDGGWYAEQLASELERSAACTAVRCRGLRSVLQEAICAVAARMGEDRPSCTVGLARWSSDELELLILGDITAVVYLDDGELVAVTDERLDTVAPELRRAYKESLRAGNGFGGRHRSHLATLQAAQRRMRNIPGGYWIAEANPEAASHAYQRTFPLTKVTALLLFTDGVSKAVTQYELMDWQHVRTVVASGGPQALFDQICQAEESDPDGRRWPRGKDQDDKALAYVAFSEVAVPASQEQS
jgi:hypothetical protein